MAVRCDLPFVLDTTQAIARMYGANLVRITQHRLPMTFGSTCHRIHGQFYKGSSIRKYLDRIYWNPTHTLEIDDFRRSRENTPGITNSYLNVVYSTIFRPLSSYEVELRAYFDPETSYFKRSEFDKQNLKLEQMFFDLLELHLRKTRKQLVEDGLPRTTAGSDLQTAVDQLMRAYIMDRDSIYLAIERDVHRLDDEYLSVQRELVNMELYKEYKFRVPITE